MKDYPLSSPSLSPLEDVDHASLAGAAYIVGQAQCEIARYLPLPSPSAHLLPDLHHLPRPGAPTGWPFDFSPPEVLTGRGPYARCQTRSSASFDSPVPGSKKPMSSVAMISAMVKQSWTSATSISRSCTPAISYACCAAQFGGAKLSGRRDHAGPHRWPVPSR